MATNIFSNVSGKLTATLRKDIICVITSNIQRDVSINNTNRELDNDNQTTLSFNTSVYSESSANNDDTVVLFTPTLIIYNQNGTKISEEEYGNVGTNYYGGDNFYYKGYVIKSETSKTSTSRINSTFSFSINNNNYANYKFQLDVKVRGIKRKALNKNEWDTYYKSYSVSSNVINFPTYRVKKVSLNFHNPEGECFRQLLITNVDSTNVVLKDLLVYSSGDYKQIKLGNKPTGQWSCKTIDNVTNYYNEGLKDVTLSSCIDAKLVADDFATNNTTKNINLYPCFTPTTLTLKYYSDSTYLSSNSYLYNTDIKTLPQGIFYQPSVMKEFYNNNSYCYITSSGKQISWVNPRLNGEKITTIPQLAEALGVNINYNDVTVNLYVLWELNKLYIRYYDADAGLDITSDGVNVYNPDATPGNNYNSIKLSSINKYIKDGYSSFKTNKPPRWIYADTFYGDIELSPDTTYKINELFYNIHLSEMAFKHSDYTLTLNLKWYPNMLTVNFDYNGFTYTGSKESYITYTYGQVLNETNSFKCPYDVSEFSLPGYKILLDDTNGGWYYEYMDRSFIFNFKWKTTDSLFDKLGIRELIKTQDVETTLRLKPTPITYYINYIVDADTESLSLYKDNQDYNDKGTKQIKVPYLYNEDIILSDITVSKPGYICDGWYLDEQLSTKLDNSLQRPVEEKDEDGEYKIIKAYIKWKGVGYHIIYHNDDKSEITQLNQCNLTFGDNDKIRGFNEAEDYIYKHNVEDNKSYIFIGWSTIESPEARSCDIEFDETLKDGIGVSDDIPENNETFHLYPVFRASDHIIYYIRFSGVNTVVSQSILLDNNERYITINFPEISKAGYELNGWYIKKKDTNEWLHEDGTWSNSLDNLVVWKDGHQIFIPENSDDYEYPFDMILQPVWIMKGHVFVKVNKENKDCWLPAIIYVKKDDGTWTLVEASFIHNEEKWSSSVI